MIDIITLKSIKGISMIDLYVIKSDEEGCEEAMLAYMPDLSFQISDDLNNPPKDRWVLGLVRPEKDGNYYKELIVCGVKGGIDIFHGAEEVLSDIINEHLPKGSMVISEDFPFDPAKLKVVKLSESKGEI